MYDAIIVGARCGGSATALLLARQGHSVLVVDRAGFPSDTFSTHFVTAPGTALLERWGAIPRLQDRGVPFFDHILLNINGNVMNTRDLFGPLQVCSPRRTDLDPVLRDMAADAGAEVRMQTTVAELLRDGDGRVAGVTLRDAEGNVTDESAGIVVGADGRTGIVARTVEPKARDEHEIHGSGLYAYFDDFEYASEAASFFDGAFLFAFPTGARSACVGTEVDNSMNGELTTGFFRHAAGPGWALVGDAACTKDPLLGHGITDSFVGAELLAAAIHNDALDQYDAALWRHLGPVYEASRDAAIDFDKSGDDLFAAVMPAQMLIREEFDMVAAGGPSLA
jgi:flavin-dependent dehydrogenase